MSIDHDRYTITSTQTEAIVRANALAIDQASRLKDWLRDQGFKKTANLGGGWKHPDGRSARVFYDNDDTFLKVWV